jgi:hypothetical protein
MGRYRATISAALSSSVCFMLNLIPASDSNFASFSSLTFGVILLYTPTVAVLLFITFLFHSFYRLLRIKY